VPKEEPSGTVEPGGAIMLCAAPLWLKEEVLKFGGRSVLMLLT
jgi:hypothetical protein